jgi:hypothetical protein
MDASAGSIVGGVSAATGALFSQSDMLVGRIGCDQPTRPQVLCSRSSDCVGINAAIPS